MGAVLLAAERPAACSRRSSRRRSAGGCSSKTAAGLGAFAALGARSLVATILLFAPAALPARLRLARARAHRGLCRRPVPQVGSQRAGHVCSTLGSGGPSRRRTCWCRGSAVATPSVCAPPCWRAAGSCSRGGRAERAPAAALVVPWLPLGRLARPRPAPPGWRNARARYSSPGRAQPGRAGDDGAQDQRGALDSFHSVAVAGCAFTARRYYEWHAVAPLSRAMASRPRPAHPVAGLGGQHVLAAFHAAYPGCQVDEVELEPGGGGPRATRTRWTGGKGRSLRGDDARCVRVSAHADRCTWCGWTATPVRSTCRRTSPRRVLPCRPGRRSSRAASSPCIPRPARRRPVMRTIGATMGEVFGEARPTASRCRGTSCWSPARAVRSIRSPRSARPAGVRGELRDIVGQMALPSGCGMRIGRSEPVLHDDRRSWTAPARAARPPDLTAGRPGSMARRSPTRQRRWRRRR